MESGTKLAHYEILSPLGKGGMGEVWRARDTKLGREVAIKTLPEEFAKDADRVARFRREAQLLASLNHPNIAAIHGFEVDNSTHFLVLELVEGDTLADRLKRGPIQVEESLKLALQVAEALEAAHEKGVIHRDLKPANVKVTPNGKVKVLDFGLAKAFAGDGTDVDISNSPTLSMQATQQGIILGTAAYMSPEQARGNAADLRSDIWAFGCVLFEMLTGRQTFEGGTVSDIMAGVLAKEPQWASLPAPLHPRIRFLLERCLEKESKDRYHGIDDARLEIQKALAEPAVSLTQPVAEVVQSRTLSKLPWAIAVFGIIVGGFSVWALTQPESLQLTRLTIAHPGSEIIGSQRDSDVAISPDGRSVAYVAAGGAAGGPLYLRQLDQLEPLLLAEDGRTPFFSPDGEWVGFVDQSDRTLNRVTINGGPPVVIGRLPSPNNARGATWGPDDNIIFAISPGAANVVANGLALGLWQIPSGGGDPEMLTTPDVDQGEGYHLFPQILPGGRAVLFTIFDPDGSVENSRIAVLNLATGEYEVLVQGGSNPQYSASGHIVYGVAGTLRAVPFNLDQLEVTGTPVPVLDGVPTKLSGAANFGVSPDGTLVYVRGDTVDVSSTTLTWVDRQGNAAPLGAPAGNYRFPRLSPDERSVAVMSDNDIWLFDIARETLTRLTFEGATTMPVWTPDGQYVTYRSTPEGERVLFWTRADGSGTEERLTTGNFRQNPTSWSPDGQLLAFFQGPGVGGDGDRDIWMMPVDGDRELRPFLETPFNELAPMFSPNGNWVAYVSDESGRNEVYVVPFPGPGGKRQISTQGGGDPQWARDGRELFYLNDLQMMAVEIETEPDFALGTPTPLFEGGFVYGAQGPIPVYDVSADGQRFLMVGNATSIDSEAAPPQINIVLNWFEELKERVPVP